MHTVCQKTKRKSKNKTKNLEQRNKKQSSTNSTASVSLTTAELLLPKELNEGNEGNSIGVGGEGWEGSCVVRSAIFEKNLNSKLEKTFTKNLYR